MGEYGEFDSDVDFFCFGTKILFFFEKFDPKNWNSLLKIKIGV